MKRHATRMVFVVIITFGLCWFPQNLRFFLQGLNYPEASFWERDEKTLLLVQSVVQTMAYANSCVNPILYGLLSERFRLAFKRTISRLFCSLGLSASGGFPFPASFGNLSTQQRFSPPYLPSKRPSSQLTTNGGGGVGGGSRRESNGVANGWSSPTALAIGEAVNCRPILSPVDDCHRKSSPASVQLMTTWNRTRLETLGEESRIGVEDSEGEEDVVLL